MNDYDIETAEYLKHGLTLFQAGLFGDSESEHLDKYCQLIAPNGVVVDMGAGVGGMGVGIQNRCPLVTQVINVTSSSVQEKIITDAGGIAVLSDYHSVPKIKSESVDFVMFNESFGYGDAKKLIAESARILKPGGRLAIKDFAPMKPAAPVFLDAWEYVVYPVADIVCIAESLELRCTLFTLPRAVKTVWDRFMRESNMKNWHGNTRHPLAVSLFIFEKQPA